MSCDESEDFGEKLDDIMGRAIARAITSAVDEFETSLRKMAIPDDTGKMIDAWMKKRGHEHEAYVSIEGKGKKTSTELFKEKAGKFYIDFETQRWAKNIDDSDEVYKNFPKYMREEIENFKEFLCLPLEEQEKWLVV